MSERRTDVEYSIIPLLTTTRAAFDAVIPLLYRRVCVTSVAQWNGLHVYASIENFGRVKHLVVDPDCMRTMPPYSHELRPAPNAWLTPTQ